MPRAAAGRGAPPLRHLVARECRTKPFSLAFAALGALCPAQESQESELTEDPYPPCMAAQHPGGATYVTVQSAPQQGAEAQAMLEALLWRALRCEMAEGASCPSICLLREQQACRSPCVPVT